MAGAEVLALGAEHDDPDFLVGFGEIEGGIEVIDHRGVQRVRRLRSLQRDRCDGTVNDVADGAERRRVRAHAVAGAGSRGRPSTRSPMMLRWISFVPAKIDAAW